MPFCLTLGEEGGPGPRSAGVESCGGRGTGAAVCQRNKPMFPAKGFRCVMNSLWTEARSSFQKQETICGRPGDSWPGSSCWSWRQVITSKEEQTLLDYSSLLTPELTLQIKSHYVGISQLTETKEAWLPSKSVHTDWLPGVLLNASLLQPVSFPLSHGGCYIQLCCL